MEPPLHFSSSLGIKPLRGFHSSRKERSYSDPLSAPLPIVLETMQRGAGGLEDEAR